MEIIHTFLKSFERLQSVSSGHPVNRLKQVSSYSLKDSDYTDSTYSGSYKSLFQNT